MTYPPLYSDEAIIRSVTYSTRGGHKVSFEMDPDGWERLKGMETIRCMMVLVPIQNDGMPDPDAKPYPSDAEVKMLGGHRPKPRKAWGDLTLIAQAGIRCNDVEFQQWLAAFDEQEAIAAVRRICEVKSRTEFATDDVAAEKWRNLDRDFLARPRG